MTAWFIQAIQEPQEMAVHLIVDVWLLAAFFFFKPYVEETMFPETRDHWLWFWSILDEIMIYLNSGPRGSWRPGPAIW